MTGFHSVMLNPDSVSRVSPPKTTMPKTLAALPRSQYATTLLLVSGKKGAFVEVDAAACVADAVVGIATVD